MTTGSKESIQKATLPSEIIVIMSLELTSSLTTMSTFSTDLYSNTTNQTARPPLSEWVQAVWWVGFACIWPPAIVLNSIVCWIILAHKTMRKKVTNYPLLNLAVADILTSSFNTPFNFYYILHNDWIWGSWWCTLNQFLSCLFISVSVFTLTAISVDRYLVLAKAFAFPQSKGVMYTGGLAIWIVSIIVSSPVYYYYDSYPVAPDSPKHCCMWDNYFPSVELSFNITFMGLTYFLPIILMGFCYTCICTKLWKPEVIGEQSESQRRMHEDRKRMVIMLIVVVTLFAVCWLPTHVYFMVVAYWPDLERMTYVQCIYFFVYWLAMSNNMMNPLIYFFFLPNFRRHLKQIFWRCVCLGSQRNRAAGIDPGRGFTVPESSRQNGLSVTGLTVITTMAEDTLNDA